MPFDLDRTLRALKPQKNRTILARRPDAALRWSQDVTPTGPPLLLDTTTYIDVLQDRAPPSVGDLLRVRTCHHSSVCLAELTHAFGRLHPEHPRTKATLRSLREVIIAIPDHRLHAPTDAMWGEAGIVAGLVARLLGTDTARQVRLLNDVVIALQACRLGLGLLTGNVRDFDPIGQILPGLDLTLYRGVSRPDEPA